MASNRVVEIVPVRVVDMVPVRLGPPVVEIVPVLVVEMIPVLVVEMVPVFANAVADRVITSVAVQTIDLRFFIALLLRDFEVRGYAVGLGSPASIPSGRFAKNVKFTVVIIQGLCQNQTTLC